MKAKAAVRLRFSSEKRLAAVINALAPELKKQITTRAKAKLTRDSLSLVLNVEATDTVALRAALNAYLRWINSTLTVLESVENNS